MGLDMATHWFILTCWLVYLLHAYICCLWLAFCRLQGNRSFPKPLNWSVFHKGYDSALIVIWVGHDVVNNVLLRAERCGRCTGGCTDRCAYRCSDRCGGLRRRRTERIVGRKYNDMCGGCGINYNNMKYPKVPIISTTQTIKIQHLSKPKTHQKIPKYSIQRD